VTLGERLIAQEIELDRQFSRRTATDASLIQAARAIGSTQGELRATHLRYHLLTVEVLTSDQLRRYSELRGYNDRQHGHPSNHHPHQQR
jgi:hypothetical protein